MLELLAFSSSQVIKNIYISIQRLFKESTPSLTLCSAIRSGPVQSFAVRFGDYLRASTDQNMVAGGGYDYVMSNIKKN